MEDLFFPGQGGSGSAKMLMVVQPRTAAVLQYFLINSADLNYL